LALERMRLQRVVTNAPGLEVPWFLGGELKNHHSREVRPVKQDQK
jgi:hypothetical protein